MIAGLEARGANVLPVLTRAAQAVARPQPLFWRLHMAPNAKIALRVGDWKILCDEKLADFELYHLAADPHETTDLKAMEPSRFAALREQLVKHNAAIDAEGPDWWRRLSPSGGTVIDPPAATKKKNAKKSND